MEIDIVYNEDCLQGLKLLPDNSVDCCVTSPPYYALRDYGMDEQIGLEETPQAYIDRLTEQGGERYNIYYDNDTKRSPVFEKNLFNDGFHILPFDE